MVASSDVLNDVVISGADGEPQVDKDRCLALYEPDPHGRGEVTFSKDDPAYKGWEKQCEDIKERVFALRGNEFRDANERMGQLTRAFLSQFLAPMGKAVDFAEYESESDVVGYETLEELVVEFNKGNVDRLLGNG